MLSNFFKIKSISFSDFFKLITTNSTPIIATVGLLILAFALLKIRKVEFSTKIIAQIGLALALSAVLHIFRLYHFPEGGDVTLGSMVPILILALVYGPEIGFVSGILYSILSLILDPFVVHPVQFLFDYPLPSLALGLAGYFKNNKIIGSSISVFVKYLFHFISGFIFFGSYAAPGQSPVIYSLIVNGSFLLTDGLIAVIIISVLPVDKFKKIMTRSTSAA